MGRIRTLRAPRAASCAHWLGGFLWGPSAQRQHPDPRAPECVTVLTSVGASSQSGAGTRSPANRGRGLRLCRLEANEGQCQALCNPPPGSAELPLRCGLATTGVGRSEGARAARYLL
ncbi:Cytochrome C Oxidase Subunit 4 Isoform 2 [Manis pentadactyla]|nr:Cytochrome C Oxidase Subunit 4 Isoform 2 [Manis pentadactyla]